MMLTLTVQTACIRRAILILKLLGASRALHRRAVAACIIRFLGFPFTLAVTTSQRYTPVIVRRRWTAG